MRRRPVSRISPAALAVTLAVVTAGGRVVVAQQDPAADEAIVLEALTLGRDEQATILELTASAPFEWNVSPGAPGELLIELPGTTAGARVDSRSFDDPLVHQAEIWSDIGPRSVDTRVLLQIEPQTDHWVTYQGRRLTIRFAPGPDRAPIPVAATQPAAASPGPGLPVAAAPGGEDAERSRLERQVTDLLSENLRLAGELRQATAEAARLTAERHAARDGQAADRGNAARRIAQLEQELERQRTEGEVSRVDQEQQASAAAESARQAEETLAALRARVATVEDERDLLAKRVDELARQAGQAAASGQRLNAELDTARSRLAADRDAATQRAAQLEEQLARSRAESEATVERLAELETTLALGTTTYRVRQDVDPCLNLRQAGRRNATRVDCLAPGTELTVLEVRDEWRRARLASGVEGWTAGEYLEPSPVSRARLDELTAELAASRAELTARLEAARAEATAQREALRGALTAERDAARTERDTARARLAGERQAARAELDEIRAGLTDEREAVETTLTAERDAARREVDRLQRELDEARLDERAARVTRTAEMNELASRVERLEEELARSATANEALASERDAARRRAIELEAELATSADRAATLEEHRDRLAAANEALTRERDSALAAAAAPTEFEARPEPAQPTIDGPSPGPPPAPVYPADPATLETSVRAWAAAWSDQRADDYLDCYAGDFQPEGGLSRGAWAEQRRRRLAAPAFIEIEVRGFEVLSVEPGRARVRFRQLYRSNSFSDEVVKTLDLVPDGNRWKIASELTQAS